MPENFLNMPAELLSLVEKRAEEDRRRSEEGKQGGDPAELPGGKERRRGARRAEDHAADAEGEGEGQKDQSSQ